MCEGAKQILFTKEKIDQRVKALADEISRDYEGREVVFVGILRGAFIFMADLMRYVTMPHRIDFIRLKSYGSAMVSSGRITVTKDIETSVTNKDVIIIEDIVDSGLTLAFIQERLRERAPRSVKTCVLIDKKQKRQAVVQSDYVGFTVEDGFLVGYGLDYDEKYRCLPDIYLIRE